MDWFPNIRGWLSGKVTIASQFLAQRHEQRRPGVTRLKCLLPTPTSLDPRPQATKSNFTKPFHRLGMHFRMMSCPKMSFHLIRWLGETSRASQTVLRLSVCSPLGCPWLSCLPMSQENETHLLLGELDFTKPRISWNKTSFGRMTQSKPFYIISCKPDDETWWSPKRCD